jgi:transcriptional regulator with XRE-family HTH domain
MLFLSPLQDAYRGDRAMLNERLKTLREARGLSQEQLATLVRIRQSHMSRIESGSIQHVRSDLLQRLADALGVSTDDLLGRAQAPDDDAPHTTAR